MDDDYDLKDFGNVSRLFPLPGVVLFPHAVLPLHIFEPRYRQMTEDALASDRLITIVQVRPPGEWMSPTEPALEEYGCLGRIFKHERLPDGRFNFLLLGRKRVRLTREIPTNKLYRLSEVRVIEDLHDDDDDLDFDEETSRAELIATFRHVFRDDLDPDLDALFEPGLSPRDPDRHPRPGDGPAVVGQAGVPGRGPGLSEDPGPPRPAPADEGTPHPAG